MTLPYSSSSIPLGPRFATCQNTVLTGELCKLTLTPTGRTYDLNHLILRHASNFILQQIKHGILNSGTLDSNGSKWPTPNRTACCSAAEVLMRQQCLWQRDESIDQDAHVRTLEAVHTMPGLESQLSDSKQSSLGGI